ncbi:MAG: hypothetical protein ACRDTT_25535, partial [Pseudonocardiaceae bacterium]
MRIAKATGPLPGKEPELKLKQKAPLRDLDILGKIIRSLILAGQRRLHRKDENDRRKHAIASTIVATDIQVTVYDAARRYRAN